MPENKAVLVPRGYEKRCPTCHAIAQIDQAQCQGCGRQFRTQFVAPDPPPARDEKTMAVPRGWVPPPDTPLALYHQPVVVRSNILRVPVGSHPVTLAIVLSIFITGAGQLVNRQYAKAALMFIGAIVLAWPTMFIGSIAIGIVGIIDTVQIAQRLNRGEAVGDWQFF